MYTVYLQASASIVEAGQLVNLMATVSPALSGGDVLQVLDSNGNVLGQAGAGNTALIIQDIIQYPTGTMGLETYASQVVSSGGVVEVTGNTVTVGWNNENNYGANNSIATVFGGQVSLANVPSSANPMDTFTFTPQTENFSNPQFLYAWLPPGGVWQNNGGYTLSGTWTITLNSLGWWYVCVYAVEMGQQAQTPCLARSAVYGINVTTTESVTLTAPAYAPLDAWVTLSANAVNVSGAMYQFWYLPPGGTWQSSGCYSSSPLYSFYVNQKGPWLTIAYAQPGSMPPCD